MAVGSEMPRSYVGRVVFPQTQGHQTNDHAYRVLESPFGYQQLLSMPDMHCSRVVRCTRARPSPYHAKAL